MTAMSTLRRVTSMDASPRQFPLKAGVKVLEGAQVGLVRGTGTIDNLSADPTLIPMGQARHTVDNTASITPQPEVYVDPGIWPMFATGLTQADEQKPAYAVDNQTFSLSSSGGTRPLIGFVWEVKSATEAWIKIDGPVARTLDVVEPGAALTNADATIQITAGKWRVLPAATLSGAHVLTLGTTGAAKGDTLKVTRQDVTANTYTINNGGVGVGTLLVLPVSKQGFGVFYFDGTNWSLDMCGSV